MEAMHRHCRATTFLTYLALLLSNIFRCQHKVVCLVVIPIPQQQRQQQVTAVRPSTILLHASSSSSSPPSPSSSPSSPPHPSSIHEKKQKPRRSRRATNTGSNNSHQTTKTTDRQTPKAAPTATGSSNRSRAAPPQHHHHRSHQSDQYLIRRKSVAVGTDALLSLNMNLDSLAKSSQQPESARRAEELLLRIEKLYEDGYYQTRPDTVSYNSVMNAYARALEMEVMADGDVIDGEEQREEEKEGAAGGLENVLRILKRMEDLSNVTSTTDLNDRNYNNIGTTDGRPNRSVKPTIVTWNTVLRSLAKHGHGRQAEQVLQHLESNYQSSLSARPKRSPRSSSSSSAAKFSETNRVLRPDTITYNSVIDAYANAHQPEDAERILRRLMAVPQSTDYHHHNQHHNGGMEGEEEAKADTVSFNTVLHAWASSRRGRDGALRAHGLLRHMDKLFHAGNLDVKPSVVSYTAVMAAWVVSAEGGGQKLSEEGETKAMELLHQCEQGCALGDTSVCPNRITYTVVINAMAKSGAADRAHEVLLRLERMYLRSGRYHKGGRLDLALKPDRKAYTSVIEAYARSGREDAGNRAVEILERMISLSEEELGDGDDDVGPDTKTYVSVLVALGKSRARGAADVAQRLLDDMEDSYYAVGGDAGGRRRGRDDVVPNTVAFNAVIDAWGRSSFRFKAERANALLRRMEETQEQRSRSATTDEDGSSRRRRRPVLNLKPDIITYNSVLNAAANSFGDQKIKYKALKIATDAYRTVQTSPSLKPTALTYSICAKAVRKLIDDKDQRERFLPKILTACVRDGMVNGYVLTQFELSYRGNGSSEERYRELLTSLGYSSVDGDGGEPVTIKSIPDEWKRNTQRRR